MRWLMIDGPVGGLNGGLLDVKMGSACTVLFCERCLPIQGMFVVLNDFCYVSG